MYGLILVGCSLLAKPALPMLAATKAVCLGQRKPGSGPLLY